MSSATRSRKSMGSREKDVLCQSSSSMIEIKHPSESRYLLVEEKDQQRPFETSVVYEASSPQRKIRRAGQLDSNPFDKHNEVDIGRSRLHMSGYDELVSIRRRNSQ
jgi:hypothetical protein